MVLAIKKVMTDEYNPLCRAAKGKYEVGSGHLWAAKALLSYVCGEHCVSKGDKTWIMSEALDDAAAAAARGADDWWCGLGWLAEPLRGLRCSG